MKTLFVGSSTYLYNPAGTPRDSHGNYRWNSHCNSHGNYHGNSKRITMGIFNVNVEKSLQHLCATAFLKSNGNFLCEMDAKCFPDWLFSGMCIFLFSQTPHGVEKPGRVYLSMPRAPISKESQGCVVSAGHHVYCLAG